MPKYMAATNHDIDHYFSQVRGGEGEWVFANG